MRVIIGKGLDYASWQKRKGGNWGRWGEKRGSQWPWAVVDGTRSEAWGLQADSPLGERGRGGRRRVCRTLGGRSRAEDGAVRGLAARGQRLGGPGVAVK